MRYINPRYLLFTSLLTLIFYIINIIDYYDDYYYYYYYYYHYYRYITLQWTCRNNCCTGCTVHTVSHVGVKQWKLKSSLSRWRQNVRQFVHCSDGRRGKFHAFAAATENRLSHRVLRFVSGMMELCVVYHNVRDVVTWHYELQRIIDVSRCNGCSGDCACEVSQRRSRTSIASGHQSWKRETPVCITVVWVACEHISH